VDASAARAAPGHKVIDPEMAQADRDRARDSARIMQSQMHTIRAQAERSGSALRAAARLCRVLGIWRIQVDFAKFDLKKRAPP
jgi:hypothetical protein